MQFRSVRRKYEKDIDVKIIEYLAEGLCEKEIGVKMFKSYHTIRNRVRRMKEADESKTVVQLVVNYYKKMNKN